MGWSGEEISENDSVIESVSIYHKGGIITFITRALDNLLIYMMSLFQILEVVNA